MLWSYTKQPMQNCIGVNAQLYENSPELRGARVKNAAVDFVSTAIFNELSDTRNCAGLLRVTGCSSNVAHQNCVNRSATGVILSRA